MEENNPQVPLLFKSNISHPSKQQQITLTLPYLNNMDILGVSEEEDDDGSFLYCICRSLTSFFKWQLFDEHSLLLQHFSSKGKCP
jgi:hypothetical protein